MKARASFNLICCLYISLLAAGCVPDETATLTPTLQQTADANGYPGPGSFDLTPPYPVEDLGKEAFLANLTPVAPAPEFSDSTGAISILLYYADTDQPVRGQLFFAAEMLPVQGIEDGFIPRLSESEAPSGISDSVGQLNISLIAPGNYALALMTPLGPVLVEEAVSNEPIIFEISANQLTDYGTAHVILDQTILEP